MQTGKGMMYYKEDFTDEPTGLWAPLPQSPAATLSNFANVWPVSFQEGYIFITQQADGYGCILRLTKDDYTLISLEVTEPLDSNRLSNVIVAVLRCNKRLLKGVVTSSQVMSSRRKDISATAEAIPLAKHCHLIRTIRLELSEQPSLWKVSGVKKASTTAELRSQLKQLFDIYVPARPADTECEPGYMMLLEDVEEDNGELFPIFTHGPTTPSNQQTSPHLSSIQPNSNDVSPTFHQRLPSPAAPQTSSKRKRAVAEIEAEEDNIEKEMEEFMARARDRKKQLREERKHATE
ncbi:MAG: hypothetical protein Q9186_007621 [Xanthomendoza sp. 1 TL-2023]